MVYLNFIMCFIWGWLLGELLQGIKNCWKPKAKVPTIPSPDYHMGEIYINAAARTHQEYMKLMFIPEEEWPENLIEMINGAKADGMMALANSLASQFLVNNKELWSERRLYIDGLLSIKADNAWEEAAKFDNERKAIQETFDYQMMSILAYQHPELVTMRGMIQALMDKELNS